MKTIKSVFISLLAMLILNTCNKSTETPGIITATPEPTPIGIELDIPVVKTIGSGGGTISASDGKLELTFPVGALSANTDISIQSITNNAPGGLGNAYRFGPSGTHLSQPVILKFIYTERDIAGSLPMFLKMAVQKDDQIWYDLKKYNVDTINKTITIASSDLFPPSASKSSNTKSVRANNNFLDHAIFTDLFIVPPFAELYTTQSKEFHVFAVELHDASDDSDSDVLPPLPTVHEVSPNTVKQWSVNGVKNGNSQYGIVSPNGTTGLFTAPDVKPPSSKNPVQLTADIKLWYKDPKTGQDFNNLKITAPVKIVDGNFSFQLKMKFTINNYGTAMFYWSLSDIVTLDVEIRNFEVAITNIHNETGVVNPTTQSSPYGEGTCTSTFTPIEPYKGNLHITKGSGITVTDPDDILNKVLILTLTNGEIVWPRFSTVCTGGGSSVTEEVSQPGQDFIYTFDLTTDREQTNKTDPSLIVTLIPK
jgi:hypothetical protein